MKVLEDNKGNLGILHMALNILRLMHPLSTFPMLRSHARSSCSVCPLNEFSPSRFVHPGRAKGCKLSSRNDVVLLRLVPRAHSSLPARAHHRPASQHHPFAPKIQS
ncbi:hypothetical protein ACHAW6_003919 [Cyclotella cf. meneghiniana]